MFSFIEKITTTLFWDDLILPRDALQQLSDIRALIGELKGSIPGHGKHRLYSIFYGQKGTGKKSVAALLGRDAGRDVYRIDLSLIVNKYIGETEKNLKKIFDAAEEKQWILFFDEADALFGKRTEIKDAHDRYANLEVSYLPDRLEKFQGLVIFAFESNEIIDKTFLRRARQLIYFPIPEPGERILIWKKLLPISHKLHGSVNIDKLASLYGLSGGSISNAIKFATLQANIRNDGMLYQTDLVDGIRKVLPK
ncbi:MAG: ATP-binding protein [Chitinophagaceae bacterium]